MQDKDETMQTIRLCLGTMQTMRNNADNESVFINNVDC